MIKAEIEIDRSPLRHRLFTQPSDAQVRTAPCSGVLDPQYAANERGQLLCLRNRLLGGKLAVSPCSQPASGLLCGYTQAGRAKQSPRGPGRGRQEWFQRSIWSRRGPGALSTCRKSCEIRGVPEEGQWSSERLSRLQAGSLSGNPSLAQWDTSGLFTMSTARICSHRVPSDLRERSTIPCHARVDLPRPGIDTPCQRSSGPEPELLKQSGC
jgi:hypothetical protein